MKLKIGLLSVAAAAVAATLIPASLASPSKGSAATVRAAQSKLGRILVDSRGRTLYLFEKDRHGKSSCNGACANAWPPLLASGKPRAGAGAKASLLGTTKRKDGRRQVTYNSHPLYTFVKDIKKGQTNGEGVDAFGAEWYVVSPAGAKIETDDAPAKPTVPSAIAVPDGNRVYLVGHAVGVQTYSCNGLVWSFVAPRANLFDDNGKLIIAHFGGPTWQATDGSTVVGRVEASSTVDATAIPWLRLSATSTAAGRAGDQLSHTTYIQRIATTGGLAPPVAECNAARAGTVTEIPYTADYYFWQQTGA
jgi:predicted lipoprotein with Yx(FWY)xxD motif